MIAAATERPEEERILRVAAYCRVSTDDIDQALSIHLQIQQYMKKIKENPNWKYAGCYVDDGVSGTNTDHRQGFQKLMKDCMDGKIDMVITKAVSRFARNLMDCIGWVEALQNHDPPVRVFFEQENLDTMSQTSGIILFVLAMVAQEESHMKSEAILLSLEWRFSRGRFLTPRLFGYDKIEVPDGFGGKKKVLSVNENEARVVRWMYSTLVNGGSPEEMAEVLTEMAIPTGGRRRDGTMNTHWTASGVVSILRNEKHCGDVLARKTYTPNYKDHKSKKNNGKKNKYFQPDHHEAIVITTKGITFNKSCISKLPGAENVELLFNPVERMMVIRPCRPDHPNAIPWDAKYKSAAPLCKVFYDSMGWETDYAFRVPCQAMKNPNAAVLGDTVLVFDLDNYVGRAMSKKDEVIIARKEAEANTEEREDAKSYYYPPDEDEPQEIRDMEEKFQQAVEVNKKLFGTPAFQHDSGVRGLSAESSDEEWDMMVEARPLDITHTVDAGTVDDLLLEIMDDPPVLPQSQEAYPGEPIVVEPMGEEE